MSAIEDIDRALKIITENKSVELAAVTEKYDRDIEALQRSREILSKSGDLAKKSPRPKLTDVDPKNSTPDATWAWPGIRPAMKKLIETYGADFTIENLLADFNGFSRKPVIERNAVATELWRMAQAGEIKLKKKDRPNVYEKIVPVEAEKEVATIKRPPPVPRIPVPEDTE